MDKRRIYRPFRYDECDKLIGRIILKRDGTETRSIICYRKDKGNKLWFGDITATQLLKEWKFSDGTVCGKEVQK